MKLIKVIHIAQSNLLPSKQVIMYESAAEVREAMNHELKGIEMNHWEWDNEEDVWEDSNVVGAVVKGDVHDLIQVLDDGDEFEILEPSVKRLHYPLTSEKNKVSVGAEEEMLKINIRRGKR